MARVSGISLFQRRDFFVNLESAPTKASRQFTIALGSRGRGEAHEAIDNPGRAMTVLAAVLAHSGRIVGDPSRVRLRMFVEWRFEQQHPVRALDPLQAALDRGKRALVVAGAGIGGPAVGHGVARANLSPVVGEVERVMVAHPAGLQRLLLGGEFLLAAGRESFIALDPRQADEAVEHVGEEETHPDAGSDLAPAQRVDAVVPVAGAQQRQAVRAQMLEREGDGETRMLVHGRALARDARDHDPGVLMRRHGLGFEEGRDLVEHGSIAAFAHIAGENVGQPEVRVARLGPLAETGAAARRADATT